MMDLLFDLILEAVSTLFGESFMERALRRIRRVRHPILRVILIPLSIMAAVGLGVALGLLALLSLGLLLHTLGLL